MFSPKVLEVIERKRNERGAILVEYAMLFVLVVIVAIATLSAFGLSVFEMYSDSSEQYTGAVQRVVG